MPSKSVSRCHYVCHHSYLFSSLIQPPPRSQLFPYTTLFRSHVQIAVEGLTGGATGRQRGTLTGGNVDRKSTRLNSSHVRISYAVFCLKKKTALRPALTVGWGCSGRLSLFLSGGSVLA